MFLVGFVFHLLTFAQATVGILEALSDVVELQAGAQITNTVTVFNTGDDVRRVNIALYDREPLDGATYRPPATIEGSAAPFITLESEAITVAPGENRSFSYTVTVPEDHTDARSYWSIIMFEPATALQDAERSEEGLRVNTLTRYAYTLVLHANNPEPSDVSIRDVKPVPADATRTAGPAIQAAFATDGMRALPVTIQAQVFDRTTGDEALSTPARRMRLYPEYERTHTFDFSSLRGGQYEVLLLAEDPSEQMTAVRFDLDLGTPEDN